MGQLYSNPLIDTCTMYLLSLLPLRYLFVLTVPAGNTNGSGFQDKLDADDTVHLFL